MRQQWESNGRAIIERCCGLDVHQETVVACLLVGAPGAQPTKEVRTFRRELCSSRRPMDGSGSLMSINAADELRQKSHGWVRQAERRGIAKNCLPRAQKLNDKPCRNGRLCGNSLDEVFRTCW